MTLIGVDGAKGGWISVWVGAGRVEPDVRLFSDFVSLVSAAPEGAVIAVDMPMGLGERTEPGGRACEIAARAFLGGVRSRSVFSTPSARAIHADSYDAACAIVREDLPERLGLSKQSWMIAPKIREVDAVVRGRPAVVIRESHPEMAFAVMNGGAGLFPSKKSAEGQADRLGLLKRQGVNAALHLGGRPQGCGADDLIDAFACLWAAGRIATRHARGFGAGADYHGQQMGIWV